MINISPLGMKTFKQVIAASARTLHLYVDEGELQGHGYKSVRLKPSVWDDGVYPDVQWEFDSGEPVEVLGYYAANEGGGILFSEPFTARNDDGTTYDTPMTIKNNGDRITVGMRINLLGSS